QSFRKKNKKFYPLHLLKTIRQFFHGTHNFFMYNASDLIRPNETIFHTICTKCAKCCDKFTKQAAYPILPKESDLPETFIRDIFNVNNFRNYFGNIDNKEILLIYQAMVRKNTQDLSSKFDDFFQSHN